MVLVPKTAHIVFLAPDSLVPTHDSGTKYYMLQVVRWWKIRGPAEVTYGRIPKMVQITCLQLYVIRRLLPVVSLIFQIDNFFAILLHNHSI
jgi:hypothetical protein